MLGQVKHTAMPLLYFSPKPTLIPQATITCRLLTPLLNAAFRRSVPSQILFSITSGFEESIENQHSSFSCSDHLNWYMQHHSLAEAEPLGKFKSLIINHNTKFNTSEAASGTQYSSFNMEFTLQKS
jgi:hypothetical protein